VIVTAESAIKTGARDCGTRQCGAYGVPVSVPRRVKALLITMRRREPPVPLTIQALDDKLDQLTAGQAGYEDLLGRLADGQRRHADMLDLHTSRLNELISGQNAHTGLLRDLVRGQERQTELLEQLLRSQGGNSSPPPAT
jgi:hypothetical protein